MIIAIDAFMWLFEGQMSSNNNNWKMHTYQIIFQRIKNLLSLNIGFILVFDGIDKPWEKRQFDLKTKPNISNNNKDKIKRLDYKFNKDIQQVKEILKILGIEYFEAEGEAEAECVNLLNLKICDFILTNDSDVLMFGGDKILKNYSHFIYDRPSSATISKKLKKSKDFEDFEDFENNNSNLNSNNEDSFLKKDPTNNWVTPINFQNISKYF